MRPIGNQRRRRGPRGFTMVEVLLVLALIAAIGALVFPALDGPFAAERLRAAAEQLQADLVRARVAAVDTGTPHRMTLVPGERGYAAFAAGFGTSPVAASTTDGLAAAEATAIFTRLLPEEIKLGDVELAAAEALPAAGLNGGCDLSFQPDGTTSTAKITLVNDRGMHVTIRIRGLTGAAAVGEVAGPGDPLATEATSP